MTNIAPFRPDDNPRPPPHSIELEQSLLGAVIINDQAFWLAEPYVEPGSFYEPLHQHIWRSIHEALHAGKKIDLKLLLSALPPNVMQAKVGGLTGAQYVARLSAEATTVINAVDYAKAIRDLADLRMMGALGRRLQEPGDDAMELDPAVLAGEAIEALDRIVSTRVLANAPRVEMPEAMARTVDSIAQAYQRDGAISGITTGLRELDNRTLGLRRGKLTILAARPSMGKSALAISMTRAAARQPIDRKTPDGPCNQCLFVSLEMDDVEVGQRLIADELHDGGAMPYWLLQKGAFKEADFARVTEAAHALALLPITIEQRPNLTWSQIAAVARQHVRKFGRLDLLVVDHMHLAKAGERYAGNRVAEVGEISAGGKMLAKETGAAVVLLAQLSRGVEQREDKRPSLSDLRWSGEIEQDADLILMLYRESYYLERREPKKGTEEYNTWSVRMAEVNNRLDIEVTKQRQGPLGRITAYCDIASNSVRNVQREEQAPLGLDLGGF